jgi:hypothetical protein
LTFGLEGQQVMAISEDAKYILKNALFMISAFLAAETLGKHHIMSVFSSHKACEITHVITNDKSTISA